jgi:hypothetical protein
MYKAKLLLKLYFLESQIKHYIRYNTNNNLKEQIECLFYNVQGLLEATQSLPNNRQYWPLFEESYQDYKKDYKNLKKHHDKRFFKRVV